MPTPEPSPLPLPGIQPAPLSAPVSQKDAPEPSAPYQPAVRRSETIHLQNPTGDRVVEARARVEKTMRQLFEEAGLHYPPQRLFIRAFKREGELEIWAAPAIGGFRHVTTYEITRQCGSPGPKRREGDSQTPEGFYLINRLNARSNFHLSLGLNYPNASDRILGDQAKPGHDIFIHGRASSIGCMPIGDDRVEEVFIAATDTVQRPIQVHVFPGRMDAIDWPTWSEAAAGGNSDLLSFWENLRPGWEYFEQRHQLPNVSVASDGRYVFGSSSPSIAQGLRQ